MPDKIRPVHSAAFDTGGLGRVSKADIAVTKEIVKAAAPLGVAVHDHLIIGRGHHSSLRDLGLI